MCGLRAFRKQLQYCNCLYYLLYITYTHLQGDVGKESEGWNEVQRAERRPVLQCYFLLSLWLTAKLPQSHRKTSPKGDQKCMTFYYVSTHTHTHTQTKAHNSAIVTADSVPWWLVWGHFSGSLDEMAIRQFKHKTENGYILWHQTQLLNAKSFVPYEGDISSFYCVCHRALEVSPCYPHFALFRKCNLHPQP